MTSPHTTCSDFGRPVIAAGLPRTGLGRLLLVPLLLVSVTFCGCLVLHPPCEFSDDHEYFRTLAVSPIPSEVEGTPGFLPLSTDVPLLVDETELPPFWNLTLNEVVQLGLENSKVLRDLGGSVLRRPDLAQTIHDPAVQATDPRFGMDGALAAFDAQLATRLFAYKNDRAFNNLFAGGGTFFFQQDLNNFVTELSKTTATGGAFALRHHVDYDANNAPANLFPSYYDVDFEGEFRQPLLQGGGVEFNRIAGPRATPGTVNGVVIARINNDVSTARFEVGLRDLISNIENGYWDLYFAYRDLDAKISARDAALHTWRIIHANVQEQRGYSRLQELQALEQYYRFQEEVVNALGGKVFDGTRTYNGSSGGTFRGNPGVQAAERRLRLLMGITINDGQLIRPMDAPPEAKIVFDWHMIMEEALATRPDLRRQQAKVQRYQAELIANRNFLLPQLDLIGRYRWRGYGKGLIGPRDANDPINNAYANLTSGMFQEWELGFEYSMPLGFRRGYAAVRNAQMHIARERAILEEQERWAVHDLSAAFADADRAHRLMQVAYNRLHAAEEQSKYARQAFFEQGGKVSLELVLDARLRLAEAESAYHRARVEYAVAVKNVHFEKGSLLEYNGAALADQAFCKGSQHAIVHRVAAEGEDPPINYAMGSAPEGSEAVADQQPAESEESVEPASYETPAEPSPAEPADPTESTEPPASSAAQASPLQPAAPIKAAAPAKSERLPSVESPPLESALREEVPPEDASIAVDSAADED